MLVDFRLTGPVCALVILSCIFPFLADMNFPLFEGMSVTTVESLQALLLLFFAIFTYLYIRPFDLVDGKKQFWIWAVLWWVLLFGRSISWGRDYFPEVPKIYFRVISIMLIAPVVFMLFSKNLRSEINRKFKTVKIAVWPFLLAIAGLIISDAIEHSRAISMFFLHDVNYKDFMEEMYEFPLIIGLFLLTLSIMKQDKAEL